MIKIDWTKLDNYGNYGALFDLRQTALNADTTKSQKIALQPAKEASTATQTKYLPKSSRTTSSTACDAECIAAIFEAYETGLTMLQSSDTIYDNIVTRDETAMTTELDRHNRRGARNWEESP